MYIYIFIRYILTLYTRAYGRGISEDSGDSKYLSTYCRDIHHVWRLQHVFPSYCGFVIMQFSSYIDCITYVFFKLCEHQKTIISKTNDIPFVLKHSTNNLWFSNNNSKTKNSLHFFASKILPPSTLSRAMIFRAKAIRIRCRRSFRR